jgi:microcystin-dependent protein
MSDPYVGEIRPVGFNFAPKGWAMCNGQILSIAQNTALFSLLGTYYGGNGASTFALPNLQGRFAVHANGGSGGPGVSAVQIGQTGGESAVTLTTSTMAAHAHTPQAVASPGAANSPSAALWAEAHTGRAVELLYATTGGTTPMNAQAVAATGGGGAHNNMPPYQVVNFIIALQGIYPARN